MSEMELKKQFSFDAAHFLPKLPEDHKCRQLHGHTFKVTVTIKGAMGPHTGWIMDFGEMTEKGKRIIDLLDHKKLNDIKGLENPTSENLALWLWDKLKKELPLLYQIDIHESSTSTCVYRGD